MELHKRKFQYKIIPKSISHTTESTFITKIMLSEKYKIIIVDMREYGENLTKQLHCKDFTTVLLDDAWCKKAYADIVFNSTMIKEYEKYKKVNKTTQLFLGSKYFIANKQFYLHKKNISEICLRKKYPIVISMGGSDPTNLSLLILKSILDLPNVKITVIIGPFFKNSKELFKLTKNKKNISFVYAPSKIWKEFHKADVAITNAGSTLYELAIQQIPTLCIPVVSHQIKYAKMFEKKGFAINLGFSQYLKSTKIRNILIHLLENQPKRKKMHLSGYDIVDGKGALRTVDIIKKINPL